MVHHQTKHENDRKTNRWHKHPFFIHHLLRSQITINQCKGIVWFKKKTLCQNKPYDSFVLIRVELRKHSPWASQQVNPFVCQISAECTSSCRCKQPPWQPTCWCLLGYDDRTPLLSPVGGGGGTTTPAWRQTCVRAPSWDENTLKVEHGVEYTALYLVLCDWTSGETEIFWRK